MPTIHFISHDGSRHTVQAESGQSLMRAATDNGVQGIDGDCGGQCACGTCHVYIDTVWAGRTGSADAREDDMLGFTDDRRETSRLACRITLEPQLDGLVVILPEGQH
jgi:2Fe-2S ferredoxin